MRYAILTLLGSLFLPLSLASASQISWSVDYNDGLNKARERRAAVLLVFWSQWSGSCLKMDRLVFSDPRVVEASKQFVMIRINIDERDGPWLAQRYAVLSTPALFFLDPWQNQLKRVDCYANASALLAAMSEMPVSFDAIWQDFRTLDRDPYNFDSLVAVGRFYAYNMLTTSAVAFYERTLRTPRVRENPHVRDEITLSLGRLWLRAGDPKRARSILRPAERECEAANRPRFLFALAHAYEQLESKEMAQIVHY